MATSSAADSVPRRRRRELLLLALVCFAPIAASYLAYYVWRPASFRNYGELITPIAMPGLGPGDSTAPDPAFAQIRGHWSFVMVASGACDQPCRDKLWQMRQLRLTQGKDSDRVVRTWIVDDSVTPGAALLREYEGTVVLMGGGQALLPRLPAAGSARDHLYLVDPLGNLMMRFPKDADPNLIKKDLTKLLSVSRIG